MATSKRKTAAVTPNLADDFLATREVWGEHMESIVPSALALAGDVGKMAVDLADSPLGQRARRNPEITFAIAVLALGCLSRLFR
jgi:hypothetical protein